jgi:hypothetical protein
MAILYAIEGEAGVRGTLADAYGVYADPAIGAALKDVPICRAPYPKRHRRRQLTAGRFTTGTAAAALC